MYVPLKTGERNIYYIIYACFRKSIVFSGAHLVAHRANLDTEDFCPISALPSLQERQRVDVAHGIQMLKSRLLHIDYL